MIYKLTDQEFKTGGIRWVPGEWHSTSGVGTLCSAAFLHAYPTALAAMFMNPIHARIASPRLWQAEGLGTTVEDCGLKLGCTQLRITQELLLPILDQEHRIRAALLASLEACGNQQWRAFANNFLVKGGLTFHPANDRPEPIEEVTVRQHAYKAAMYEEVEFNSAMAIQCACQYKKIAAEPLLVEAYGHEYIDTPARGASREGQAFRSSP